MVQSRPEGCHTRFAASLLEDREGFLKILSFLRHVGILDGLLVVGCRLFELDRSPQRLNAPSEHNLQVLHCLDNHLDAVNRCFVALRQLLLVIRHVSKLFDSGRIGQRLDGPRSSGRRGALVDCRHSSVDLVGLSPGGTQAGLLGKEHRGGPRWALRTDE